jgi:hypothetical protein
MTEFQGLLGRVLRGWGVASGVLLGGCVPAGNSTPSDSGVATAPSATVAPVKQALNVMTTSFEDSFDRTAGAPAQLPIPFLPDPAAAQRAADAAAASTASTGEGGAVEAGEDAGPSLGPDWYQAQTTAWHLENGRLCGQNAHNHGVWLKRVLPINARIEFDAVSESKDGDLKAELWGDGQSAATSISYTNATSYLTILGGWKNTFHVLARINEHGTDRKEIKVDPNSDDPREKPVTAGQIYHFKIERTDGKTVRWFVDGLEYLSYPDTAPLAGVGHDHFGFNDWEVKVCFDNVKVTPL